MSIADAYTGSGGGLNEAHKGLESGRAGHDGIGPARTFHCNIGSVKVGESARASLDYIRRKGEHKGDAVDVESEAGYPQAVLDDAGLIEASARIKRGANAERQLVTEVYELPADSTPENRKKVAEAVVADWRGRGHKSVAVVHMHGDRTPQPHLHVAVASRPVDGAGNVDRSRRLLTGRDQIRAERAHVAEIVNRICEPEVRFHPGRLIDTGIERPARKRIPPGEFRKGRAEIRAANGAGEPDRARAAEAAMYAESAKERLKLHARREARRVEIGALKAARRWAPKSQRQQLKDRAATWENIAMSAGAHARDTAAKDRKALSAELFIAKNERSTFLTGVHREGGRDLPDLETGEGRDEAWVFARAEMKARRDEAMKQRERAEKAEGRVRELEALNRTQTEYVTDWHGDRKVELPDLATVEGQSAAWANMRAWEAGEKKRRKDEAAEAEIKAELEKERHALEQRAAGAEASVAALTREKQEAETRAERSEGRVRELEAQIDAEREEAGPEAAAAVREAQPAAVPDAAPKPPDLPAAWTLPVGELMKAGDAVAQAALTWGKEDSSPTAMPLDGIADSPVLTFTPERGLLRKKPASWRYEDAGRYAGKAAIEIEHAFNGRDPAWSDWRAAAELLSRALVTDALEDGAETPRWLEEQFPDLDKKYGPKIRTREYHGEHARTYVGEMSGGEPHGAGTMTWTNGSRYEGAFENGHCHGHAALTYADGDRYEGQFENGLRHGQGVYDFPSGGRYEGGWQKGKRHGPGIETTADGQRTEGVWKDGKRVEAAAKEQQAEPKKTQTPTTSRNRGPELD